MYTFRIVKGWWAKRGREELLIKENCPFCNRIDLHYPLDIYGFCPNCKGNLSGIRFLRNQKIRIDYHLATNENSNGVVAV